MALRSGTPVNLSALRRDYSALPQIAAIKAQANQGILDSIKKGIENRKQKEKDAAETQSRINVIQNILNTDLGKRVFGDNPKISAKDIDTALGKDGQKNLVSILDILGKADIEEDKIKAQAEKERVDKIKEAIKRDLMSRALTSTGGLNITPDMLNNISKKYNVPMDVVAGLRGEVINNVNTIGNQKLEAEFKRDPNFRKYIEGLRTLDPNNTNLHDDLFDEKSVLAMLGGGGAMGVTVAALGATAALPLTIGILGGAALAGAGVSAYNKWKGKKEFEREGLDLPSIQSYNEVLFRNPEMIQAAGLNGIFDAIGGKRLNETVGGEKLVLRDNTTVTAFGLESSDSPPSNFVPYFDRVGNESQGQIQLKENSEPSQKQPSPEQIKMIQQIMMNQVPGV